MAPSYNDFIDSVQSPAEPDGWMVRAYYETDIKFNKIAG